MLTLLFYYTALCDPHFDRREAATARLAHLIDRHPALYGPVLGDWCRAATCPEVRSRALRVLGGYARWRAVVYAPSEGTAPVWPICDAYPVACPVIPFGLEDARDRCRWPVEHIRDAPKMVGKTSGPNWASYRATTERRVRAMIREGMTWSEADDLVRRMWVLECRSRHDCGKVLDVSEWSGGYLR
ncbi:MAG: hypothetical protein U0791_26650 [Gemmataceae bacterium]